jgi:hypothetical protein
MSYQRGLDAINLKKTDKVPQTEYIVHPKYLHKLTGIDPYMEPRKSQIKALKLLNLDIVWVILDKAVRFQGDDIKKSDTRHSHAQWGIGQTTSYSHEGIAKTAEELIEWDIDKEVEQFFKTQGQREIKRQYELQKEFGESAMVPGVNSLTLFHNFQEFASYEAILIATLQYPEKFKKMVDKFGEASLSISEKWASNAKNIKLFVSHDDIAMSTGPLLNPNWLIKYIFPWYKKIWQPLREKGIKILFISDGQIEPLIDDLVEAGADGFMIEPMVNLEKLLKKYGGEKIVMGNADARILTTSTVDEVQNEVRRCIETGKKFPGYVFNNPGGFPHNIPLANIEIYFEASAKLRDLSHVQYCVKNKGKK